LAGNTPSKATGQFRADNLNSCRDGGTLWLGERHGVRPPAQQWLVPPAFCSATRAWTLF